MNRIKHCVAVVVLCSATSWAAPRALADNSTGPQTAPPVAAIAPPSPTPSSGATGSSRVLGGVVLGAGVIAAAVGGYLAASHDCEGKEGCSGNLTLAGLGIGFAGVGFAMFGTFLLLSVPQTRTGVALSPSGLALRGSF